MQVGVEESALAVAAVALDRAATTVAAIRFDALGPSVASALPGSRCAGLAATVGDALDAVARGIVRDVADHAEAVRTSGTWYRDAEQDAAAAGRHARGTA
jgi:hypothetical protein